MAGERRAERLAAEAAERAEWLERKLDMAKRAAELAGEQIEQWRTAAQEARDAARHAEAERRAARAYSTSVVDLWCHNPEPRGVKKHTHRFCITVL